MTGSGQAGRIPEQEIDRVNLGADLRDVAARLGVPLKRSGKRWTGPCPVCASGSFTISPHPAGGWRWACWASGGRDAGAAGRALDLLAAGRFRAHSLGWSFRDAVAWLGGDTSAAQEPDPKAVEDRARERAESAAAEARERAAAQERARAMWAACMPLDDPRAGPVRSYLADNRGLDPVAALGGWPAALRFGEVLPFKALAWGDAAPRPAMVAAVVKGAGSALDLVGVHRTFLARDPETGVWGKDVARFGKDAVKQSLGPIGGGAVRLTKSPRAGGRHLVTEGLETGLRVALSVAARADAGRPGTGWYVWAALSTAGLYGLDWGGFAPAARVVMGDHDRITKAGTRPGEEAAQALAARSRQAGIPSAVRIPPTEGADWDDVGMGGAAA